MLLWQTVTLTVFFIYNVNCNQRLYLSCAEIMAFVDGHNFRRLRVAQGWVPGQPSASHMMNLIWDVELAEKATKWAENGVFEHNPDKTIGSLRWEVVGENIYTKNYTNYAFVVPNIDEALEFWFLEHQNYGFEPFVLGTEKPIGHYTQMVWENTTHVGCGIAQRKENNWISLLYVCNYGPTGNYLGQRPYRAQYPGTGYLSCIRGTHCYERPYGPYC